MGLIGKAVVLAGGYYLYKQHNDKKRVEREFEQYRNTHEGPSNRDMHSQSQLEFQRDAAPSYAAPSWAGMDKKGEQFAGQ